MGLISLYRSGQESKVEAILRVTYSQPHDLSVGEANLTPYH